jgi:hypothetical protein
MANHQEWWGAKPLAQPLSTLGKKGGRVAEDKMAISYLLELSPLLHSYLLLNLRENK